MRLIAVMAAIFFASCPACDPEYLDHGRLIRDGNELCPMMLPFEVISDGTLEAEQDDELLSEATAIWNEPAFPTIPFSESVVDAALYTALLDGPDEDRDGHVFVTVESIPPTSWDFDSIDADSPGGDAYLKYNAAGEIRWALIRVSYDIAYHRRTVLAVLVHELGHSLGLGHDEQSIDLNSCMSFETIERCQPTSADITRVQDGCL